eukprot:1235511-Rhodomonas_salina.2
MCIRDRAQPTDMHLPPCALQRITQPTYITLHVLCAAYHTANTQPTHPSTLAALAPTATRLTQPAQIFLSTLLHASSISRCVSRADSACVGSRARRRS